MYRISSTDTFHHGRTFDSLAAAKQFADRRSEKQPGTPFDVLALVDRECFRVAYSPTGDAKLGTYKKVETAPGLAEMINSYFVSIDCSYRCDTEGRALAIKDAIEEAIGRLDGDVDDVSIVELSKED